MALFNFEVIEYCVIEMKFSKIFIMQTFKNVSNVFINYHKRLSNSFIFVICIDRSITFFITPFSMK